MTCPILTIRVSREFKKSYRKLHSHIQSIAEKKEFWFRNNAFDVRLHTHKLKGELEGFWSYSVNYSYRVLFRFINDQEVLFYDIGTHDIYK